MSFYLDWWMLILFGVCIILIERILQKIKLVRLDDAFFHKYFQLITIIIFYIMSGSLFVGFTANGPSGPDDPIYNPFGLGYLNDWFFNLIKNYIYPEYYSDPAHLNATSTEFMYSSGLQWLKDSGAAPFDDLSGLMQHPFHLFVGIAMFMLYPYFLKWGIRLGQILFGSKPGKKGFISAL